LPEPQVFGKAFSIIYNKFDHLELSLMGGEPTAFKGLDWAFDSITKAPNKYIVLDTNASKHIDWWEKYAGFLAYVVITYHLPSLELAHLISVLGILKDRNINFQIKLPVLPKYWDDVVYVKDKLESMGYASDIQLLYKNFTKGNNEYYQYSEQQLNFYYKDKNVDDSQIEQQIEYKRINKLNDYYGHICWAGIDQLVIDKFGYIYRGWCSQGGEFGNVFTGIINWPTDPILCQKHLCTNGFDLEARKSKNTWGRI
jgi:hypothetical protein